MKKVVHSRRIAIVVELFNKFGADIFSGIGQYVYEHPHWETRHLDFMMESSPPSWLKTWRGDGIIVRDRLGMCCNVALQTGAKIVDLSIRRHPGVPTVFTDQHQTVGMAVTHLRNRFFQNLAFVGIENVPFCNARRDAFLRIAGLYNPVFAFPANPDGQTLSTVSDTGDLENWLETLPKPVGIVACYDPVGVKILEACERRKIPVPGSVAVVGINNDEVYCQLARPPMSSVTQNGRQTGYLACQLLESLMNGDTPQTMPQVRSLGVAVRRSTDTLALEDPLLLRAVRFIQQSACSGISISEVAENVGCCRRTLERRFQKTLNRSVLDAIQHVRIQSVCDFLRNTDWTLELIGLKTGFSSLTHLHKLFKHQMGMTPSEYRRKFLL